MQAIRITLGFCLLHVVVLLHGQYFQFSQYNFSTQRVNPAWIGLTRHALVDFSYRNQKTGGNFQLNTNFLSVAYPFFSKSTGKPWSGLGIALLSDKSGLLFKSQEAAVTYGVNIPTGRNQALSLGFKGLMRWQRINLDGLFTGSQYLEGRGFQPALDNGEVPQPFQNKFFTLSSGLLWQETDRKGKLLKQIGFSFFDFNKPNPAFLDGSQDELPSTIVVHGAWRVYQNKQLGVLPEFLLTQSATKSVLVGGGRVEYALSKTDRLDFLFKYAVGRSGIFGLQLHRESFSVGFSYDFPVGIRNVGNLGALEVGLEYRTPVDPKSKPGYAKKKNIRKSPLSKKKKKTTPPKRYVPTKSEPVVADKKEGETSTLGTPESKTNPNLDSLSTTKAPVSAVEIEMVDTLISKTDGLYGGISIGSIQHEPHLIEKVTLHFRFDYNSTDLDDETEEFLHDLSVTLRDDPTLSIEVIGHTDNIGKAQHNQHLSLKRAEVAKSYLTKLGVEDNRINTEGRGMDEPLNENLTEEQRALNRRVEIKILKMR
jgi:type IX secretion system PorP/SprF family membrane protein